MSASQFKQRVVCPNCGTPGKGEDYLAPGQYRCPQNEDCQVVTFLSDHEMYRRKTEQKRTRLGLD